MCGIAGSVNYFIDSSTVNKSMIHRGPDDQASCINENVQLHHLRLSIVDILNGKQPMSYLNRYVIVFNGEIYNHLDIRKQLNLQCITNSDTETILQAWHSRGPGVLDLFDGMFAFALLDTQEHLLYLIRDRAGKKPIYYFFDHQKLVFASELNALNALLPLQYNEAHLSSYLRNGSFFRTQTPYKQTFELEGGNYLKVNIKNLQVEKKAWWDIGQFYQAKPVFMSEEDAMAELDRILQLAVQSRLESSDVEVGCFLSGGIDSGIITAIAAKHHSRLKTFTVSFDGQYNEAPLANLVAKKYNTDHHEIRIDFSDLNCNIEKILSQYGEPFYDSSAIPSTYVSKVASQHLKVILNGDGADELLGGYRRQVPFSKYDFFKTNLPTQLLAKAISTVLPHPHERVSKYNYIYRLASLSSRRGFKIYLGATTDIFEGFEKNIILPETEYLQEHELLFNKINSLPITGLRKLMWLDFDVSLFNALLPKIDIATMAYSLEGRSPMLCKSLLEWAPTLPDDLKIRGGSTKYLLRKLGKKYLPSEIIHLPKRGFEVPLKSWINTSLSDAIHSYLLQSNAYYPNLVNHHFIKKVLLKKVKMSEEKRAKILWSVFCMEVWHKQRKLIS